MFAKILIANRGDRSLRDAATKSNRQGARRAQATSPREKKYV
jgi:hypothetical protein